MEGPVKVGDNAAGFRLKNNRGKEVHLSDYRGRKVLLSWHPLAWTSVCANQMRSLEANCHRFEELNCIAFGLSIDSVPCKNAWAKNLGLAHTDLLSDFWPHGGVARAYGVFREQDGFSDRANILLDENQTVAFVKVYPIPQLPDIEEIMKEIEKK